MSLLHGYCTVDGCERPRLGALELCASHAKALRDKAAEESKPKKAFKPLQRVVPPKKVSNKRSDQLDVYYTRVEEWKIGKMCKVCEDNGDLNVACEDCHHMRGKENELLLIEKWWLPVCRKCHTFLTENSRWALENGYSLPRTTSQENPTI